ncbi:MAG TPA: DUF4241 domain-containing protein [Flavobacteriales bacterium]|jgi:hypothetical protein|nr:DUF4241 domain-containing protein [Flavobacteriales bacterium]
MGLFALLSKRRPDAVFAHVDYNAIIHGTAVDGMPVEHLSAGELLLPTGRIVVCDPLAAPHVPPLAQAVKPGNYPITLHLAHTTGFGARVALAEVRFKQERADQFQLALRPGEDVSQLEEGADFFGFPVEAGLGGLLDAEAAQHYAHVREAFHAERPNGNLYTDLFEPEFSKNVRPGQRDGDWTNYRFPGRPDLNVVMFSSGYGDGVYPVYWGLSRQGEAVSLVVDLQVLLLPEENS